MFRSLSVGYFANAQYDVRSPIGTPCHFAYAADAPLLSLSRHFPRFSGGIYPEGGSEFCFIVFARKRSDEAISREGGGLRSIYSVLFQGDCHGTSCLAMTTSRAMVRWDSSLSFRMTCKKIYVILSVSEISHDQSEKVHIPVSSSVGFFTSFRMTYKKVRHIER